LRSSSLSFFSSFLKNTSVTPIHVTFVFGIVGLIAAYSILTEHYFIAAIGLILKSIVDAMDGELARIKETPSYSGRYLDSIFDSLLNFLFILVISYKTATPYWVGFTAFLFIQLQGTLYNYYYVILRHRSIGGDTTSKIFEMKPPVAYANESQTSVNVLFRIFQILYLPFDWFIFLLDTSAYKMRQFPNWFMSMISIYGLGFQLMLMALMLVFGLIHLIIPFFIMYTGLIFVFVAIRKIFIK
jgi:phosphatidylglycerophosphate synthase